MVGLIQLMAASITEPLIIRMSSGVQQETAFRVPQAARPFTKNSVLTTTQSVRCEPGLSSTTTQVSHNLQENGRHEEIRFNCFAAGLLWNNCSGSTTCPAASFSCGSLSSRQALPAAIKCREAHFWIPSRREILSR